MLGTWAHAPSLRRLAQTGLPLWAFTLFTLLTTGAWLAWNAYGDYRTGIEREYHLLEIGARDREARVAGVMRSIEVMMGTIEEDWAENPHLPTPTASRMLRDHMRQLPEIRSLVISNSRGLIIAATTDVIIGFDASQREYFTAVRDAQPDDRLHISRPFKTITDVFVITVARALHDKHGNFLGVLAATIDPHKFGEILPFNLPTDDSNALLIHEAGDIIYAVPEPERYMGRNLVGGAAYTQHLAAGAATTRHRNVTKNSGKEVLAIFHKIPGTPLIVVVSRDYAAVMAVWQQALLNHAAGFGLIAAIMVFLTGLARRHQQALQAERDRNRLYLDTVHAIVLALDARGRVAMINRHGAQVLGSTPETLVGRDWFLSCMPQPEGRDIALPAFRRLLTGDLAYAEYFETHLIVADGSQITVAWHTAPMRDAKGHVVGTLSAGEDITDRQRNEQALKDSERFLRSLIDIIPGMVGYWSADLKNGFANAAYRDWFGKTPEEIRGMDIRELMGDALFEESATHIQAALAGKRQRFERSLTKTDGSVRHTWTHYIPDLVDGEVHGFFVLIADVTEMKLAQLQLEKLNAQLKTQSEQLRTQVYIDGLTGIANRRRFDEALRTEWRSCRRNVRPLALLMIDIDHFKRFNDHYGHQAGDVCLQAVARVLKSAMRRPHDLAARYGGEEFVCLLPDSDLAGAQTKAEELRAAVAALQIAHTTSPTAPHVTVSVGIAVRLPDGDSEPESLLADSDAALYAAKNDGRNRVGIAPVPAGYADWESRRWRDGEPPTPTTAADTDAHSALSQ